MNEIERKQLIEDFKKSTWALGFELPPEVYEFVRDQNNKIVVEFEAMMKRIEDLEDANHR